MNFEVLRSTIHGQSLVSSRHFGPGELVIQDPILFRVATDRLADAVNTRADAMLSMQQLSPEVFNEAFASAPLRQEQLQAYSAVDATSDLNRFQIVSYDMSSEWSQRPEAFGYGELCTFLNHSCQSNLIYYWNPKEDAMQLRAVAQISPREELTVNYLAAEAWMTRAERQESLNRLFKIDQCGCSKCSGAASDASDARIREIRGIEQTLITFIQGERVVEDILNVAKTFIYQCELELNLQTTPVLIFPDQLDPRLVNAYRLASIALDRASFTDEAAALRKKACHVAEICFGKDSLNIQQHEARFVRRLGLKEPTGNKTANAVALEVGA